MCLYVTRILKIYFYGNDFLVMYRILEYNNACFFACI